MIPAVISDDEMGAPPHVISDDEMGAPPAQHAPAPSMVVGPRDYSDESLGIESGPVKTVRAGPFAHTEEQGHLRDRPKSATPWSPRDKLREDAGPFADDWIAQGIAGAAFGEGAGEAAGPLLSRAGELAPIVQKALPIVRNAIEGGANTKAQGGDALPGAATAAGLALLGPLGRAAMNTAGGKSRQFIEARGGRVGLTTPGSGGPFESMDVPGTTDADIGEQAASSAKKGLDMLNTEARTEKRGIGKLMSRIDDSPAGSSQRDVTDLMSKVGQATGELDTAPMTDAELRSAIDKVTAKQKPGFNPDVDPTMLSERDINKLGRRLDRAARTGTSTDEKLSPLKQAAHNAREMRSAGPYKIPNDMYAETSQKYRESRRLLGINERPRTPEETQTVTNTLKNKITRRGQNTVTAGGQADDLAQFEERHPDIGLELSKPALLRNKADLSFKLLPQKHGGLIDRTGDTIGTAAMLDAGASLAGHGHLEPWQAAIALLTGLGLKNAKAIDARVLYPLAERFAGGQADKLVTPISAVQAAQERK